jgi:hypothetical protein
MINAESNAKHSRRISELGNRRKYGPFGCPEKGLVSIGE